MGLYKTEVLGTAFNCITEEGVRKMEHEYLLEGWIGNRTGYLGYQRTWKGFSDLR